MSFFPRGYFLTISTPISIDGFLSIEKGLLSKEFKTFYDDENWAKMVLENSKIKLLTERGELPNLFSVKISGRTLKLSLNAKRIDEGLEDEVKRAIELLLDVIPSLESLPSSSVGSEKERLRNWILYYTPAGIFIPLSALGIYWMIKGYRGALCEDELFLLGFKVLTPLFLAHLFLAILLLGKHLHLRAHLLSLLILYFAGYYLTPLVVLEPFNARFDNSEPKVIETKILEKYSAHRGGFRVVLELTGCSFRVSERFYNRAKVGDVLVLQVKDGAFGIKWAYRYYLKD
ncbi:hypothetical protein [Thermocrinis sp.]|uniref:hypothetical protein n=1 Tax=Thermocrinis sp. TaxID=2024383 RepID=UPI002FDC9F82